jgi:hypothetical protein
VLAGLSVAFDASCEEMWLAWRHGACLVHAPRALVRTGVDLGPWLEAQRITIVSTVPTLAALWPPDALEDVRLLIFGGEACPPELAERVAVEGREVWNTYGPTEATVVACAAQLTGAGPVRIGLPLDGWDLAAGQTVTSTGRGRRLVIGGVGLARYLDPARTSSSLAPTLADTHGRRPRGSSRRAAVRRAADDQAKLGAGGSSPGGRRRAAQARRRGAAAAVPGRRRRHRRAGRLPRGHGSRHARPGRSPASAARRASAPLVPHSPSSTTCRCAPRKVDRDALPWPLPGRGARTFPRGLPAPPAPRRGWRSAGPSARDPACLAAGRLLRARGGSLSSAQLVRPRTRLPRSPSPMSTTAHDSATPGYPRRAWLRSARWSEPCSSRRAARVVQELAQVPVVTVMGCAGCSARRGSQPAGVWATVPWALTVVVVVLLGWLVLVSPPADRCGRDVVAAPAVFASARTGAAAASPAVGAEAVVRAVGAENPSGAAWTMVCAALGASGRAQRPEGAAAGHRMPTSARRPVESQVDLAGHWLDGDVLHVGRVRIGRRHVGSRSTPPGRAMGQDAEAPRARWWRARCHRESVGAGTGGAAPGARTAGWAPRPGPVWVAVRPTGGAPACCRAGRARRPGGDRGRCARRADARTRCRCRWPPPWRLVAVLVLATHGSRRPVAGAGTVLWALLRSRTVAGVGTERWSTRPGRPLPLAASLVTPTWLRLLGANGKGKPRPRPS